MIYSTNEILAFILMIGGIIIMMVTAAKVMTQGLQLIFNYVTIYDNSVLKVNVIMLLSGFSMFIGGTLVI